MIRMKISIQESQNIIRQIDHEKCQNGVDRYWKTDSNNREENNSVTVQSICWLFCWAKTGMRSAKARIQSRHAFDMVFDHSFDWLDQRLDHEHARIWRYSKVDITNEFLDHIGKDKTRNNDIREDEAAGDNRDSGTIVRSDGRQARTTVDSGNYSDVVTRDLWNWAHRHHRNELDGDDRPGRPPVLSENHAARSILVPPDTGMARRIQASIPKRQRHRWFRSLKSSQALTQTVFGAVRAYDRLDLLQSLPAECGRPAFFDNCSGYAVDFEYEVNWLGEPRRTSVDVMIHGPRSRVAVECKFTEREFGRCSRPNLRPRDANYLEQHCDSSYRVQRERRQRCALTEIGVRYWEYLPDLFDWPADRDHVPCPFGGVYQLARNALAAAVTPEGSRDPARGHVLVVYDARNPEFLPNGAAETQWRAATMACRVPGLLRRLSWQRLAAELIRAPELTYLVDGIRLKYGLIPT